jgi:NAD(P)-dependent dehydrogenase (short-subunit alcohol dehydrogenase family)
MVENILVIGGAGGVGSAVVERLVDQGRTVETTVLAATEASAIETRYGGKVKAHIVDLSNAETARDTLTTIVDAMPSLDAAVNCAAVAPWGPMELTPLATYLKTYEINVGGGVAMYQAAMPALRRTGGRIVLIGSMGGRMALPFMAAYICTKFALEGLGDIMRREAAPQGVKVSIVQPGGIRTNMVYQQITGVKRDLEALQPQDRERYGYLYESFLQYAEASMSGSGSTPAQVAAVVAEALDAAEPASRYIAGDDAKEALGAIAGMSDGQADAMLVQIFRPDTAH